MIWKSLLLIFCCIGTVLFAADKNKKEMNARNRSPLVGESPLMHVNLRHIEAGGIGYQQGYTTLEAFLSQDPLVWPCTPFVDLRGHVFNDGRFAANAGAGLRTLWDCRVYGMNVYYDYRQGHHKGYNQIALGLETLGNLWDLRINGYLPVGGKLSHPYHVEFDGFQGNSIYVKQKFEYSMKGIDSEIGFHIGKVSDIEFQIATGPYYFKGPIKSGAIGGKIRALVQYKNMVALEIIDSYDSVFHNNFQGQVTFTFPFGPKMKPAPKGHKIHSCSSAEHLLARMVQNVPRQEIVVLNTAHKRRATSDFVVFVDNLSHSAGTFEEPYSTLSDAQNASNSGDIIYVFPGDGTSTGMNGGIVLKNNQKLWGSGVSHALDTNLGAITIPNYTDNTPQITNSAGVTIALAKNNQVSGFFIIDSNDYAIYGVNPGIVQILSSTFLNTAGAASVRCLYEGNATGSVDISDIVVIGGGNRGVSIGTADTSTATATITNSYFSGTTNPIFTVSVNASALSAVVKDNTIYNNTGSVSFATDSSSLITQKYQMDQNIVIGTTGDDGFELLISNNAVADLCLKSNDFINNFRGVNISLQSPSSSTLVIENNRFNNTTIDSGCQVQSTGGGFVSGSIQNNVFQDNGAYGLHLFQSGAGAHMCLDIQGNTSSGNTFFNYIIDNTLGGDALKIIPCNAASLNAGGLLSHATGVTLVESCPSGASCP